MAEIGYMLICGAEVHGAALRTWFGFDVEFRLASAGFASCFNRPSLG